MNAARFTSSSSRFPAIMKTRKGSTVIFFIGWLLLRKDRFLPAGKAQVGNQFLFFHRFGKSQKFSDFVSFLEILRLYFFFSNSWKSLPVLINRIMLYTKIYYLPLIFPGYFSKFNEIRIKNRLFLRSFSTGSG